MKFSVITCMSHRKNHSCLYHREGKMTAKQKELDLSLIFSLTASACSSDRSNQFKSISFILDFIEHLSADAKSELRLSYKDFIAHF